MTAREFSLRPARPGEATPLSELCLLSKAYWGYPADFLDACRPYLRVEETDIEQGHTWVAQRPDGAVRGVCQIAPGHPVGNLDLLFIHPDMMGKGIGRALFWNACDRLRAAGERRVTLLSDPQAESAYLKWGAHRIEMRASDVFPGRLLPWMAMDLR
ncbi:GNAT family N-acetyltransferase [Maricaulis sp. D1M11]|uniref:GNAT family N-acetyltransferase n=1 Tax=Maricaulis sp. D1M11 TaxID=3076117 RepID=UPI0039B616FE